MENGDKLKKESDYKHLKEQYGRLFELYNRLDKKVDSLEGEVETLGSFPEKEITITEKELKMVVTVFHKLGLITKRNIRESILEVLAARDLIKDAEDAIEEYDGKYTVNQVLKEMENTGIKEPEVALKFLIEKKEKKEKETSESEKK